MLNYEWANPSSVMLYGSDSVNNEASDQNNRHLHHHHHNTILDHYNTTQVAFNNLLPPQPHQHHHHSLVPHHFNQQAPPQQLHSHFDPSSVYAGASSYAPPHHNSMLNMDPTIQGHHHQGIMMIPKREDLCPAADFVSRIGLNLGGRTYFSSEDDFMSRLYRRSRPGEEGVLNSPRCQAEGCHADLSQSKHYHRRHKVCEFHSKAPTVIANGLTQRFCQQCSRLIN